MNKSIIMLSLLLGSVLNTAHIFAADTLQISQQEQDMLGIRVQTVDPAAQSSAGEITLRVAFAADGQWAIKTPLSGILHRVHVQRGDRVQADDPLLVVRSAEMVSLQRDYLKARAEMNLQTSNWQRDRKLADAGSISERRWQETRFAYDTARAEFAGLRGQLRLAGFADTDLEKLAETMEVGPDIVLRAPVDAVVLDRQAMLGDQLDGHELLVSLGETAKLVLEGDLSSTAAAGLYPGVELVLKGGNSRARISHVSSVIDPQSQTVHVRAEPLDAAGLSAGRLAVWEVLSDGTMLTIPSSAVVKLDGRDVVYLATSGGFEVREIRVKSTGSGTWMVYEGLSAGDRVAVAGTAALKGMSLGMGGGDE